MPSAQRTLAEACAPIFLYLTTFRRNAATSSMSIEELREALTTEVANVGESTEGDPRLAPLFERIWYALVVTADQVILSSAWAQRTGWSMQLLEMHYFNSQEGGRQFYVLADEVLADPTDQAAELAEVLFLCMGLGFQGELIGERRELERRRRQLFEKARLAGRMGENITPEAYGRNAARSVMQLPTMGIARLGLVALGAVLFMLLAGNAVTEFKVRKWKERAAELQSAMQAEED